MDTIDVRTPPVIQSDDATANEMQSIVDTTITTEAPSNAVLHAPSNMQAKLENDRVTLRRDQMYLQQMQTLFNFILGLLMLFIFFIFLALVAKGTQDMAQAIQDLAKALTTLVRDEDLRNKVLEYIYNNSIHGSMAEKEF